jgi:hypothetical protein
MYEVNLKAPLIACVMMRTADTLSRYRSIFPSCRTTLEMRENERKRWRSLNGLAKLRTYCGDLMAFSVILLRLGYRSILLMGIWPTFLIFLQVHTDLFPLSS